MKLFYTAAMTLLLSCCISAAQAQLTNFSFAGAAGDEIDWPSDNASFFTEITYLKRGPGLEPVAFPGHFGSRGWTVGSGPDPDDYIEFTITPKPSLEVTLLTMKLQHLGLASGPRYFVVRTARDNFAANVTNVVHCSDITQSQASGFMFNTPFTISGPLTIRLYAFGADSEDADWGPGGSTTGEDLVVSGKQMSVLSSGFTHWKAVQKPGSVTLNWTALTARDISYYALERSTDGQHFSEIHRETLAGVPAQGTVYSFGDGRPGKVNYYRVKAVAANARSVYSSVIRVEGGSQVPSLLVYPQPLSRGAAATLGLNNLLRGNYTLSLYHAGGRLLHSAGFSTTGGSFTQALPVANLSGGMYFIRLQGPVSLQQSLMLQ